MNQVYHAQPNGAVSSHPFKAKLVELVRHAKGFATARENRTTLMGGIAFAAMFILFVLQMRNYDDLKQRVAKMEGLLLMKASNSIRMDVSQATKKQERRASRTNSVAKKQRRNR